MIQSYWNVQIFSCHFVYHRSLSPRGLRRGSAAACLLEWRVQIPSGNECLSLVSVVCCQVEVCATGRSPVPRSPTGCMCDFGTSTIRGDEPRKQISMTSLSVVNLQDIQVYTNFAMYPLSLNNRPFLSFASQSLNLCSHVRITRLLFYTSLICAVDR